MTNHTQEALNSIAAYELELKGISQRFPQGRESLNMASDDRERYDQIVIEIRDLLDDLLGTNTYSRMVIDAYNEGVNNFFGGPSLHSVKQIISCLSSVTTRINRKPGILLANKISNETMEKTMEITPPDKVTLKWLINHVHITLWFWLFGLVMASFILGVTATTKLTVVQEWVGISCKSSEIGRASCRERV